ncbi:MAG: diaminopimelate epimerase [Lachnospiraceae bacterium]|nr:diaminopimelate epimerase [Lachnospiraceae bacterium]
MRFTKMHGIGNDYVYVDGSREHIKDPEAAARFVSDRHFGIGSDGLIIINPSDCADFAMDMYNADGSRGRMCGNGIRCVGKYVYDHGLTDKTRIDVETLSGIKTLDLTVGEDGKVKMVRVDMGAPILTPEDIPVRVPGDNAIIADVPAYFGGRKYKITCVSMGNPHCVVFEERDLSELDLKDIGPDFENSEIFPERVNTEFVRIISRDCAEMRVWERGSGETWACGTGACAAAVAAMLNGYTDRTVNMKLLGGDLLIEWDETTGRVFMTGPAEEVFEGTILNW